MRHCRRGEGNALSKESCAKTFGGRTGLSTLSNNFRQFSLWLAAKSRLGPMKKPGAVRLEQAPSAVSRLFRDCYAILGLLRRPTPDLRVPFSKLTRSTRDRNDGGLPTSITRSVIAAIWKMLDQACLNPALFHLRRISGARYKSSPIHSTGGSNQHRQVKQHRPPKVFAQLSLESAYPRSLPSSKFCLSINKAWAHSSSSCPILP